MPTDPTFAHRKAQIRRRGIYTAALLAVVVVVLRFLPLTSGLFLFTLPENFAYDFAYERTPPHPPPDVVIVAIDEVSLQPSHLGRFPWPRRVYAQLLQRLADARVVAFDVLLSEPDSRDPESDREFARAIARHGRVVLAAYKAEHVELAGRLPQQRDWSFPRPPGPLGLTAIQPANFLLPLPQFAAGAAAIGYVDIVPDSDGVYRRVDPVRGGYDGKLYPHFATAIARVATGADPADIVADLPQRRIRFGSVASPLSDRGAVLITYSGPSGTITRVPCYQVLEGKVDPALFRDKIVLVGATAPGLYDIRPAPYRSAGRQFLGVETNANVVDTLLRTAARADASFSLPWGLLALLLGLLVGWLAWSLGDRAGPLLAALVVVLIALPSFFLAFYALYLVPPYGALLYAALLPLVVAVPERLGSDKRIMQSQFAAYVSPDVLRQLTSHPDLVAQGVRRQITLLFSDVRGSTTLSEKISPEIWVAQLNEYLGQMSEAIFAYDGYLDKFMGDGIMAIWNAFGNQPDHADLAAHAALEMLRRLDILNQAWERMDNRTPLRIGIGIHTGEAIIGNVGSEERMQYTAIGDAVNTAARIEGLTKTFSVQLLVSETAAAQLRPDTMPLVEIGEVEVRGRTQGIRVFARPDEYHPDDQRQATPAGAT